MGRRDGEPAKGGGWEGVVAERGEAGGGGEERHAVAGSASTIPSAASVFGDAREPFCSASLSLCLLLERK